MNYFSLVFFVVGFAIGLGVGLFFWYRDCSRAASKADVSPHETILKKPPQQASAPSSSSTSGLPPSLSKLDKNAKISNIQRKYGDKNPETNPYYKKSIGAESLAAVGDMKGVFARVIDRMKNPPNPLSKKAEEEIHAKLAALKVGQSTKPADAPAYSDKDYEQPENKTETS